MHTKVQPIGFTADQKLIDFVEGKFEKLKTFSQKITTVIVILKLDNVIHAIKDKVVSIRICVAKNPDIYITNASKSFEQSYVEVFDASIIQLNRIKTKQLDRQLVG